MNLEDNTRGIGFCIVLLILFFSGCASDFYSNETGQLIPNQKYLVGAGSMVFYDVQNTGTIYLVANNEGKRKVLLSRFVEKGDNMSFELEDSRIQKALRQASINHVDVFELYFVPGKDKPET